MPVRAAEFYSGIGGLHLALTRSNIGGSVVQAFDWDQTACRVYAKNHNPDIVKKVDISTLDAEILAPLQADLWLLSPACQPYTVLNPNAKGASDPRARSFLHLMQDVLPELVSMSAYPNRILVENVAGFEASTTRRILLSTLRSLGYTTIELLLTPLQFGIPNSRLRYYLLAKKAPLVLSHPPSGDFDVDEVWRYIPGHGHVWDDPRLQSTSLETENSEPESPVLQLSRYLDESPQERLIHLHAVPDRVLQKWGRLFDIVHPSSRRSCCFTRGYTQLVERAGSIIQMNEGLDTTGTFDKFLEAQSKNDTEAIRILHPLRLRYFSPTELLRLFHFDLSRTSYAPSNVDFVWPEGVSTKTKYRLIGNSVNVRVVTELINFLFE